MKYFSGALILVLLFAGVSAADTGTEPRQSFTAEGKGILRGGTTDGATSYNEHEPLRVAASPTAAKSDDVKQRTAGIGLLGDPNFWFFDVDVDLFSDFDRDGYYFGIDLNFDADTNYSIADVFAVIFLSYEYGPWNEYAETADFTLFGTSGSDDYTVETELISGYPTGSYDILIELYDSDTGLFLASIGPEESAELSLLPLEDSTRDSPRAGETQVVVNSGGGGSIGWLLPLVLLAVRMTFRPHAARPSK
jgi:hypothetical protein